MAIIGFDGHSMITSVQLKRYFNLASVTQQQYDTLQETDRVLLCPGKSPIKVDPSFRVSVFKFKVLYFSRLMLSM